jgi:hypothetical protein
MATSLLAALTPVWADQKQVFFDSSLSPGTYRYSSGKASAPTSLHLLNRVRLSAIPTRMAEATFASRFPWAPARGAMKHFYRDPGTQVWSIYGFRDAFNLQQD